MTIERLGEPVSITEASVQELHLELLRRTSFNALDGPRVAESLLRCRDLWTAVMLDRLPIWSTNIRHLPTLWLVPMRDMPHNIWNADTLYILTDAEKSPQLIDLINSEDWGGEVIVHDDREELSRSLGSWRAEPQPIVVTVWWD